MSSFLRRIAAICTTSVLLFCDNEENKPRENLFPTLKPANCLLMICGRFAMEKRVFRNNGPWKLHRKFRDSDCWLFVKATCHWRKSDDCNSVLIAQTVASAMESGWKKSARPCRNCHGEKAHRKSSVSDASRAHFHFRLRIASVNSRRK